MRNVHRPRVASAAARALGTRETAPRLREGAPPDAYPATDGCAPLSHAGDPSGGRARFLAESAAWAAQPRAPHLTPRLVPPPLARPRKARAPGRRDACASPHPHTTHDSPRTTHARTCSAFAFSPPPRPPPPLRQCRCGWRCRAAAAAARGSRPLRSASRERSRAPLPSLSLARAL
mmetsp:Transcript_29552/g.76319  ORF Transcript_29552/g.76319 Transcript_29552/m.76319 type:complete len:176 (-) Transcript_29552:323-850(-)